MKKVILLKNLAKSAAGRKEEARTRYIYIYIHVNSVRFHFTKVNVLQNVTLT